MIIQEMNDTIKLQFDSDLSDKKLKIFSYNSEKYNAKIDLKMDKDFLVEVVIHKALSVLPQAFLEEYEKGINPIKVKYDQWADSAFIYLVNVKLGESKSTFPFNPYEIGAEINLDFDKDDKFLSIEVLYASKHLPRELLK